MAGRCLLQRQVRASRRSDVYRVDAGYETDRLSHLSRNIGLPRNKSLDKRSRFRVHESSQLVVGRSDLNCLAILVLAEAGSEADGYVVLRALCPKILQPRKTMPSTLGRHPREREGVTMK